MDVFLSHSAADKKLAERLSRGLDVHGLSVWLDRRELTPGSDLRREIEEAVGGRGDARGPCSSWVGPTARRRWRRRRGRR